MLFLSYAFINKFGKLQKKNYANWKRLQAKKNKSIEWQQYAIAHRVYFLDLFGFSSSLYQSSLKRKWKQRIRQHYEMIFFKCLWLIRTILEHFLVHRTFLSRWSKLGLKGNLMDAYQYRLSKRRTVGSQFRVGILDGQRLDPLRQ